MANQMDVDVVTVSSPATQTKDKPESPKGGGTKKRKSADPPSSTEDVENADRKNAKKRDTGPGKMCHQCHQKRESFLSCTSLKTKKSGKKEKTERCGTVFCDNCLERRYDQNARSIAGAGRPTDMMKILGHVHTESYVWKCPVCAQECNCSTHRRASGLPPTGFLGTFAKQHGVTIQQLLQDPSALEAAQKASEARRTSGAPNGNAENGKMGMEGEASKAEGRDREATEKAPEEKQEKGSNDKADGAAEKVEKAEKAKKPAKAPREKTEKPKKEKEKKEKGKGKKGKEQEKTATTTTTTLAIKPSHPVAASVKMPIMTVPPPPKPFVRRPKLVQDPEFEFIAISHPLTVIDARLRIREFVLRFEKSLKLIAKYVRIINDPNTEWTNLTYKNLITRLLVLIQSDENPTINSDIAYESVEQINRTAADDVQLWEIFKTTLETVFYVDHIEDFEDESTKLEMVNMVIDLALGTTSLRQRMDQDLLKEKEIHQNTIKEIKDLRAKWEEEKQAFQKERLLLAVGERTELEERFRKARSAHNKLIALAEQREWFASRKLTCRTMPLGIDSKGNLYHHFIQRARDEEDWGQWVVVQKNPKLPHPSGNLPKTEANPTTKEGDDDDDLPDLPEPEDEETVKERIWYAVSGAADVRHLGDWIQYHADLIRYNKATADYERAAAAAAAAAAVPSIAYQPASGGADPFAKPVKPVKPKSSKAKSAVAPSPSRQLLAGVHMPSRTPASTDLKLPLEESWTEEGIKSLVSQLHKIAGFLGLSEEGVDHLV